MKIATGIAVAASIIIGALATSVHASEQEKLSSALSNVPPNNARLIAVAEFRDLGRDHVGQNPHMMTVKDLTSNRMAIADASSKGGMKLCEVKSVSNPVLRSGGVCVSAQNKPSTITVGMFKHGTGAPQNERVVSLGEFQAMSMATPTDGVNNLDCQMKNGKSTGNCRIASSK